MLKVINDEFTGIWIINNLEIIFYVIMVTIKMCEVWCDHIVL
jgi:hypothetical protein